MFCWILKCVLLWGAVSLVRHASFLLPVIYIMRIADYQISKCKRRRSLWRRRLHTAVVHDLDDIFVRAAATFIIREDREISKLKLRTRHVQSVYFNINILSDQQCLGDFRFKKQDIGSLCERVGWSGVSHRNEYSCDQITAFCSFLFRLATNCRWYDHELKFGFLRLS